MTVFWHACDKPHMFTFHPKKDQPGWLKVLPLPNKSLDGINEIMLEACSHPKATFEDMSDLLSRILNTSDPVGKITRGGGVSAGTHPYKTALKSRTLSVYSDEMLENRSEALEKVKEDIKKLFTGYESLRGGLFWESPSGQSAPYHEDPWTSPYSMRRFNCNLVGFRGNFLRVIDSNIATWKLCATARLLSYLHTSNLQHTFAFEFLESHDATSPILQMWYGARVLTDGSVVLL